MRQFGLGGKFGGASLPHDAAFFQDVVAVDEGGHFLQVLVDHQNRLPFLLKAAQAVPDLLADQRGQAFGSFVQDKQAWIDEERAPDRGPFLLPARHGAGGQGAAFRQAGAQVEEAAHVPAGACVAGGGDQVFFH